MTRHTDRSRLACCLALALATAGCGGDAESAATGEQAPAVISTGASEKPWDRIPPDSLYGATPVENLAVTEVVLDVHSLPTGWEGMRIAAISDLQLGLWDENEEVAAAAIRLAVEADPDLIVLLGDYIADGLDTDALRRVLAPLRGRTALAVLGDRDVRSDSVEAEITRALEASGVRVLRNGALPVTRNGSTAAVAGVHPDLVNDGWGTQEYVLATLGGGAVTPLLLLHHPPLLARAPERKFAAALAGNTVCGPVEVPGTPRLAWLVNEALPGGAVPGADRFFVVEETVMFVTCGVGYSFVPTRFGGRPEVAIVTLRSPAGAPEMEEPAADTTPADSIPDGSRPGPAPADTTG